jgi:para-aminobenzoate synthetase/4-amino-4-deoxychorismate lyase
VEFDGNEFELYQYLLQKQSTPYSAFIKNKFDTLLSFSPELFFAVKNNHIITKPMKGTIKRGKNEDEDAKNINFLKNDIKNRAENIMIVDLLRNDLGKIAKPGSIKVTGLFDIETHPTLHQMTSRIEAD